MTLHILDYAGLVAAYLLACWLKQLNWLALFRTAKKKTAKMRQALSEVEDNDDM